MDKYERAIAKLKKYHQDSMISFLQTRQDNENRERLVEQILEVDLEQMMNLYSHTTKETELKNNKIEPVDYVDKNKLSKQETEKYSNLGEKTIMSGKYAVATMAGGQGTRLGCDGPKGKFLLELGEKGKYLFEILAENLKEANSKYNVCIPWYIMTSKQNHEQTVSFFEEKEYFGYPKENVMFFTQGELPLLSKDGQILLGEDGLIKEAADGNGGIFSSMQTCHVLQDMKKRKIEWIFIGAVDNVLLNMVDPILLGLTIEQQHQIGCKSVVKANPQEKVGVFCKKNGKPGVIEYTELPQEMTERIDEQGELVFGESHIMCNLFRIEAIEKIAKEKLPYHIAVKKATYLKENGEVVVPEEPNAYKFESFIFDSFSAFDDISVLRGKREDDFAPIKNATGVDSPQTAKKLYENFKKKQQNK